MKTSITLAATVVALAVFMTTCASVAKSPEHGGRVYLVGVAGGG